MQGSDPAAVLRPYLPRLQLQWLAERPDDPYREVDGTVVFVDVSGFTQLSEQLARVGKLGAEELADAIGSCFARLLAVAYGEDGSLLKFGGDALLLLFTGDEHARRATRSAVVMRRTLREIGRLQTSGGRVVLRMSVGVHTGTYHFLLVGGSHRELIVTGPAATRVVEMESAAAAGEILISPQTAALLPRRALGEPKGAGLLLRGDPGPGTVVTQPEVNVEDSLIERSIPTATREHLRYGSGDPEHRRVTVAFLHYDGTDELLAMHGPAFLAKALDELTRDVQDAVDGRGVCFLGTDVDRDGGKMILTAGAPVARGDDEERMLLAVRRIADGTRTIPVRIGVNRGHVFAGDIGPAYRRTYTVMGDAVNLAARVMAAAAPGRVLVTTEVLERSRTRFRTEALEPFRVKGKAEPVVAHELGPVLGARHEEEEPSTALPFVGRGAELAALEAALGSARDGNGRIVQIVGEAGIGKSRLLDELSGRATGFRLWRSACEPYEASTPYFPFRRVFRQALGIEEEAEDQTEGRLRAAVEQDAPRLAPWLPLLGLPLGLEIADTPETSELHDRFRKERAEQVIAEFLARLAPTPTLLAIEDVHWMDEASGDLLRRFALAVDRGPWLICVTRRDVAEGFDGEGLEHVESLRPSPLEADAAAAIVEASTEDTPLTAHEVAVLAERSGGNPLFLRELLTAARAAGSLEGLPESVEALVTAQIDRLRPRDRTLLRYAAVLGQRFDESLILDVLRRQLPSVDAVAFDYLSHFVVREPDGTIRFHHALIRDAAYEGLSFRRRRVLHALAGETIESNAANPEEQAELLSFHFFHSNQPEKAWRYSLTAGERAKSLYANLEAAEFYGRAIGSAARIDVPAERLALVHESLGDVRDRAGVYQEASSAYSAARRLVSGEELFAARLLLKEAEIRERLGRYTDALRWYRRGLRAIGDLREADALRLRAQLSVGYASIRQGQGRNREAIKWCEEAVRDAEASGARDVVAHAALVLDWIYRAMGRPQDAPYPGLALEIFTELDDVRGLHRVYTNLGIYAYFEGRWDEAADLYERAHACAERMGDSVHAAFETNNLAEILSDQGELEEAERLFLDAFRVWRASGFREGIAYATGNLGRVASRAGRHQEAEERLLQARELFDDIGEERPVVETDARLAENMVQQERPDEALLLADEAGRRAGKVGEMATVSAMLHRLRGYALLQQKRVDEARHAFERSLRVGREAAADYEIGVTIEAMARLELLAGDADLAHRYIDEVTPIFERLGVTRRPVVPLPGTSRYGATSA